MTNPRKRLYKSAKSPQYKLFHHSYWALTYLFLNTLEVRSRKGGSPKVNQQKLNQAIAMFQSKRMTMKEIQEATGVSAKKNVPKIAKESISQ